MWITDKKQISSLKPKAYKGKYWQIPNDKLEFLLNPSFLYKIIDNGNNFDIIKDEEKIKQLEEKQAIKKQQLQQDKELIKNKKALQETDYKIIKLMEQFLLENQNLLNNPEYDINELHQLRQNNRDIINKLNEE